MNLSIFCVATIYGGNVFAAKPESGQNYQQVLQAQIQSSVYEQTLAAKLNFVARAFENFYTTHGRLPEEGNESRVLERTLSLTAGNNAYSPEGTSTTPVTIKVDLSLSRLLLPDYEKPDAPYWKTAKPGSITIVHNTEDYFLISGNDIDGKALKTVDRSKTLLVAPGSRN